MRHITLILTALVLTLLRNFSLANDNVGGSCWSARLCCQGRNLTCHVTSSDVWGDEGKGLQQGKNSLLSIVKKSTICFCDSACLPLNDCCHDYQLACRPIDCVVSDDWSAWSECDARCGQGMRNRTRRIIQLPQNGGKACPPTVQRAACVSTACKVARANEGQDELRETAKIIPAKFGTWRDDYKYNPFKDIRRNIFERYHRKHLKIDRAPYCMKFEFTEVWPTCRSKVNTTHQHIYEGNIVCVECQSDAMRRSLGTRCKGHGIIMKETRWKAVLSPGCHGKWVLRSRQDACSCSSRDGDGDFILL